MSETPSPSLRAAMALAAMTARALGPGRYVVADLCGLVAWAVSRRRRKAIQAHLRADPTIGPREARRRARASFREYARTTADFFWAHGVSPEILRRRARVVGLEHLDAIRRQGRGAVIVSAHLGSWDIAASAAAAHGIPLVTVMAPLGPEPITRLVAWARERAGVEVLGPTQQAARLLRSLRSGRFAALLCDIPLAGPTVVVRFRGGPVRFSSAPVRLARRAQVPLLPVACWREGDGYVVNVLAPIELAEDDATVMQRVADSLEAAARRSPTQWYPFGRVYVDES